MTLTDCNRTTYSRRTQPDDTLFAKILLALAASDPSAGVRLLGSRLLARALNSSTR